jgi:hypothetical protein
MRSSLAKSDAACCAFSRVCARVRLRHGLVRLRAGGRVPSRNGSPAITPAGCTVWRIGPRRWHHSHCDGRYQRQSTRTPPMCVMVGQRVPTSSPDCQGARLVECTAAECACAECACAECACAECACAECACAECACAECACAECAYAECACAVDARLYSTSVLPTLCVALKAQQCAVDLLPCSARAYIAQLCVVEMRERMTTGLPGQRDVGRRRAGRRRHNMHACCEVRRCMCVSRRGCLILSAAVAPTCSVSSESAVRCASLVVMQGTGRVWVR